MDTYIKLGQYQKKLEAMRKILDSMLYVPEAKESKKVSKLVSRTLRKKKNTFYPSDEPLSEEKSGDAA